MCERGRGMDDDVQEVKFKLANIALSTPLIFPLLFPLRLHVSSSLGIFHCVFGDLQESLVSACREALDTAAQDKDRTIVCWMNGFAAVSSEWRVIILEMVSEGCHYI